MLVQAGPGWFARVIDAATPTLPPSSVREVGWLPLRWPARWWGLLVGLGMIGAGLGAAAITLGPVLLWYDREYLGVDVARLHVVNHHLVHFPQHDRITMAGTMVAIGVLYVGLAVGGIRRGWPWAREVYLISGWIGFPPCFTSWGSGLLSRCTPRSRSCSSRCSLSLPAGVLFIHSGQFGPKGRSASGAGRW